ncbi:hypothetical protein NHX12_032388 [Muraenolepis orangiensis]|uniref:Uncharacterized protein n=1 Tax=Muraenolepis orangiensis TaxID=630683 RepID=A0A9Q0IKL2_9TELE|nr:hypothetical protein NHX12_032388 [Muraenolepis orangiensis]
MGNTPTAKKGNEMESGICEMSLSPSLLVECRCEERPSYSACDVNPWLPPVVTRTGSHRGLHITLPGLTFGIRENRRRRRFL